MRLSHNTMLPALHGTCTISLSRSASSTGRSGVKLPRHGGGGSSFSSTSPSSLFFPLLLNRDQARDSAHSLNRLCSLGQHSKPPCSGSSVSDKDTNACIGLHF